jgi:tRNA A-37 threonylcarbamoyl transferase component Bud32
MSAEVPTTIGRYQIVRSLGEGGMGAVYLAQDPAIDRQVAIKLMRSGFDDPGMRERFAREAKSIGRLRHANIVTVFDVGEHRGEPFIAMEFIEGQTLGHLVRHPELGTLLDRLTWIDGVCAGLSYAHRAGIIHRDIKPANIMIDGDGAVKILDFGIARGTSSGSTHTATQAGTILGTLNYMSPEQLSGRTVDHRTDIFSAGAVFYEVFAGRMAFPGDIQSGVLHFIMSSGPVEPLAKVCPTLDPALLAFVERCLARDVEARYADLSAARRDLAAIRHRLESGVTGAAAVVADSSSPSAGAASDSRPGRTPGPDTRAELQRLRHERITQQLGEARAALARADFTGALDGCRQALIIDPDHSGALELEEQVEAAQQAHDWLVQARTALDKGALTSAAMLVDRVLGVLPSSPAALDVRKGVEQARQRLAEIERRARIVDAKLTEARAHLAEGRLDAAADGVAAALDADAGNADALAVKAKVAAAIDARRRAEEEARAQQIIARAQAVVTAARQRFAAGDQDAALALLRAHQPKHVLVEEAIGELERERREIERRAELEREAERKRLEDEARRARDAERREAETRHRAEEEERKRHKAEEKAAKAAAAREAKDAKDAKEARDREEADRRRAEDAAERAARTVVVATPTSASAETTVIVPPRPREAPAAEPTSGRRSPVLVIGGIAAVVVIGIGAWLLSRSPSAPAEPVVPVAPAAASVLIDIRPWADVERVQRKSDGTDVDISCHATPCIVSLPPGEYHARAKNPYFQTLDFDFTVGADGQQDVRRTLPNLNAEDEVRRLLGGS